MLLSRVADNIYWAGRYLERAETTARLVKTHTELYLDLPLAAGLGWTPLLAVTGSDEAFREEHEEADEDAVVSFLVADAAHSGSVVTSIARAREALRVTRGFMPQRSWEIINELYHRTNQTCADGVDRRTRLTWTEDTIRRCHLVDGSMHATMTRDEAYCFLEIGRFVERADMTTRVLDVQAGILMSGASESLQPYADLTWRAVLRSLGAEQMFRRALGGVVSGPAAVGFLLRNPSFPRSVEHCLIEVSRWLLELPTHDGPMAGCAKLQRRLAEIEDCDVGADELHLVVDDLQRGLAALHDTIHETFLTSPSLAVAH
jgi:uncharacterized alpha-E superfamily protein